MIAERLTGLSVDRLAGDELEMEVLRGSQELRTQQSQTSLALVCIVGIVYYFSFSDRTNTTTMGLWTAATIVLTVVRSWVCVNIQKDLAHADASTLMRNEVSLFFSAFALPLLIGSGYWLVALPGDERVLLAITLLSAMYSIGSTINSMTQIRLLPILLVTNLGQGIAFFAGLGNRVEPAIAVLLLATLALELGFAFRNSAFFRESVRIRLENLEQYRELQKNQTLIESSLSSALEASRSKSHFLAAASHDLRQPLHALYLFLGTLRSSVTDAHQLELIQSTSEAADQMRDQFDALLNLSSLDAGGVVAAPRVIDLQELLQRSLDPIRQIARDKGLALECDIEDMPIVSDPLLLDRLLGNLLSNAVRYTQEGSVRLSSRSSDDGRHAVIDIQDTGIGIPTEESRRIFDDFTQLNNPARSHGQGSGLGLAIAQRLANLLGILIDVESEVDVGTRFRLTVPATSTEISEVEDFRPTAKPTHVPCFNGYTMLIVDDNDRVREALTSYISSRNGKTVNSANIDAAREHLQQNLIDFAIVDDMLGGHSRGLEFAKEIANKQGDNSVILVTGSESPDRLREIEASGITLYRKPLTPEQLDLIIAEKLSLATPDSSHKDSA